MTHTPVLTALRAATAAQHSEVEADADVERRLRDLSARREMVEGLYAFHAAVEASLEPWREALEGHGVETISRTAGIAREWPALPTARSAPMAASLGEALGRLYVVEGSMLGGRVMRKGMRVDGIALDGLAFLDPYGEDTGARWRAFMARLEFLYAEGVVTLDDVVRGGRDAFAMALATLVPKTVSEYAA